MKKMKFQNSQVYYRAIDICITIALFTGFALSTPKVESKSFVAVKFLSEVRDKFRKFQFLNFNM